MFSFRHEQLPVAITFMNSGISDFTTFISTTGSNVSFSDEEIKTLNSCKAYSDKISSREGVINQHYVPRFYLKLFANADGRLETLDLKKKIVCKKPYSTKQICSDTYFY